MNPCYFQDNLAAVAGASFPRGACVRARARARACDSVRSPCVEADTAVSQRPHCSSHYLRFQSVATLQSTLFQHSPPSPATPMCLSSLAPVAPSSPSLANLQHGLEVLADPGFVLRSGRPAPGKLSVRLSRTFTPIFLSDTAAAAIASALQPAGGRIPSCRVRC